MDSAVMQNNNNTNQPQSNSETKDTFVPTMLYCGSDTVPPPPVVDLVKTTKVANPLTKEQLQSIPKKHEILCKCGCIPAIPSMFQMAELRKQAREKAKREQDKSET